MKRKSKAIAIRGGGGDLGVEFKSKFGKVD